MTTALIALRTLVLRVVSRMALWISPLLLQLLAQVPNILSLSRALMTIPAVWSIQHGEWQVASLVVVAAGVTDFLDGYLARLLRLESPFGKLVDPVADKIFVIGCWWALFFANPVLSVPLWFPLFILVRELLICAGGLYLMNVGRRHAVVPSLWGKANMAAHTAVITWMFVCHLVGWAPHKTYAVSLILLLSVGVISLIRYLQTFFKALN